jgi:formaldehyde-activating enzyme involved in methanogenesis
VRGARRQRAMPFSGDDTRLAITILTGDTTTNTIKSRCNQDDVVIVVVVVVEYNTAYASELYIEIYKKKKINLTILKL